MALKKPDKITQEEWDSMSETDKNDAWKEQYNYSNSDKFRTITDENGKTVIQKSSGEDLTGVSSLSGTNKEVSEAIGAAGASKQTDKTTEEGASKAEVIGFTQAIEKAKKEAMLKDKKLQVQMVCQVMLK